MSVTESFMLPLGTTAPDFQLPDTVTESTQSLNDLKGENGTLIIFMCNHCPYIVHIIDVFVKTAAQLKTQGVSTIGISSNSVISHPQDSPDNMKALALSMNFSFPYLYDETQEVAKRYKAACTPDLYLFDKNLSLVYRGRFDDSTPGRNVPVTGADLKAACDLMLAGKENTAPQHPSMGCNIKWHE